MALRALELPRMQELMVGALLHDTGKLVQRAEGVYRKHAELGAEFLATEEFDLPGKKEVLDCVRHHHKDTLRLADLEPDSLAYIVYEADNIAAALDRRQSEQAGEQTASGLYRPLESIFNYLGGEKQPKRHYHPLKMLDDRGCVNYPQAKTFEATSSEYKKILHKFKTELTKLKSPRDRLDSLLKLLEATFSYIPSTILEEDTGDISLYDHTKITAAVAACMYAYFTAAGIKDYREHCLGARSQSMRRQPMYLLVSGDLSGVQNFIYTITSSGALRSLRGRSFYLELLLENIADELLQATGFTRANLLYTGGGHFYLLLPAIPEVTEKLEEARESINRWFLRNFSTKLYLALAWEECAAVELMGDPDNQAAGSGTRHTGDIFRVLGEKLGREKLKRYTPAILKELADPESELNRQADSGRECQVCRTSTSAVAKETHFEEELELCRSCHQLMQLGGLLPELEQGQDDHRAIKVLTVAAAPQKGDRAAVMLPAASGETLYASFQTMEAAERRLEQKPDDVRRIYSVNRLITGGPAATNIWAGTYAFSDESGKGVIDFESLARQSRGIKRLAVLRADVDELGGHFSRGFGVDPKGRSRSTLSRYATLSRWLSLFFKDHINDICRRKMPLEPFSIDGTPGEKQNRPLVITYSGGDDLFVVGAWDQVIEFAVDLRSCLTHFSCGRLRLSAGIGFFKPGFPVYRMAEVTAELEKAAKDVDGKDAVALFGLELDTFENRLIRQANHCYKWDEFVQKVCRDKVVCLQSWLKYKEDRNEDERLPVSRVFLYKLLVLTRERLKDKRLPLARLAYLLARMEPKKDTPQYRLYKEMREKLYHWLDDREEARRLLTALYLVIYLNRRDEKDA